MLKNLVLPFTLLLSNVNSQKPGSLTFVDGKLTEINLHSGQNKLDALLIKGLVDKIKEHPENILPAGLLDTLEKANPQVGSLRTINRNYCENGVCEVPISLHALWGYGCWCNFGEDLLKGSGPPVNKFDELCKSLTLCTRCVAKDNVETGCDPSNVTYVTPVNIIADEKAIQVKCAELNPDNACGQNTCCCEMDLLAELLNLLWSQEKYEDTFLHENGWSREENCVGINNGGIGNPVNENEPGNGTGNRNSVVCCGAYPNRQPYRMESGQSCCDNRQIYNPLMNDCCDDQVRDIGSCQLL